MNITFNADQSELLAAVLIARAADGHRPYIEGIRLERLPTADTLAIATDGTVMTVANLGEVVGMPEHAFLAVPPKAIAALLKAVEAEWRDGTLSTQDARGNKALFPAPMPDVSFPDWRRIVADIDDKPAAHCWGKPVLDLLGKTAKALGCGAITFARGGGAALIRYGARCDVFSIAMAMREPAGALHDVPFHLG